MTGVGDRFDWGRHDGTITAYVNSDEIGTVTWFGTRSVNVALGRAVETAKIATVAGPFGCGKTFAVARACEAYLNEHPDASVAYIRGGGLGRGRQVYEGIFTQLSGVSPPTRWSAVKLREEIARHIHERPGIIVFDEAQRLTKPSQEAVQEVCDLTTEGTGIVLVGDTSLESRLIGELKRRRPRDCEVRFSPIDQASVAEVVAQLHPVLGATDDAVLRAINKKANGLLSRWAEIVGNVVYLELDTTAGICAEDVASLTDRL